MGIAHWDEVEKRRLERGQMAGTWSNLGVAAGTLRAGASRIELAPGEQPTFEVPLRPDAAHTCRVAFTMSQVRVPAFVQHDSTDARRLGAHFFAIDFSR